MRIHRYDSVEEMMRVENISSLTGKTFKKIEIGEFENEGFSGNSLEKVTAYDADGQTESFVLKHFDIKGDWLMRLTHDDKVREVALYLQGVYQALPENCVVPILATAKENNSWATLMEDVSDILVPSGDVSIPAEDIKRHLEHAAEFHAKFMADDSFKDPKLGLTSERDWIMMLSPEVGRNEVASGQANDISGMLESAWEKFYTVFPPESVQIIKDLQENIEPLLTELNEGPRTFLHGDYKYANLGSIEKSGLKTIMIDWGLAIYTSPLLELTWFLAINSAKLTISKEEIIQSYRESLAKYGHNYEDQVWDRMLVLGVVSNMLRLGWAKALGVHADDPDVKTREIEEVKWWAEQINRYCNYI